MPSPFAAYQTPIRSGCSARVYHVAVMSTKAGSAVASKAPPSTRSTASSVKVREAAWHMRRRPQKKICGSGAGTVSGGWMEGEGI
jgi:hypothetical protein